MRIKPCLLVSFFHFHRKTVYRWFWTWILVWFLPLFVFAQQQDSTTTSSRRQSAPSSEPSKGTITFTAKDSLLFSFKDGRKISLFGAAQVEHQNGGLKAGTVTLDLDASEMSAESEAFSDTLSQPVLSMEGEEIRSRKVRFNYETKRGKFEVARMQYDQGNIIGTEVKNKTEHVVFVGDGIYSTCELDHPHYYIKAKKMKVVDEEEVFFTNAKLYILDIPYPLIFPFGYVPAKLDKKQSGPLSPTYAFQQTDSRGLGLQNVGWFQYFNDYLTGTFKGDIFTSGTFNLNSRLNYRKLDAYNGSINLGYFVRRGLEPTDPSYSRTVQTSFSLNHNQQLSPYATFDANIDLRSSDYNTATSLDIDERAEVTASSKLGYTFNDPNGRYNFGVNVSQNQNFFDNTSQLLGPSTNFSLRSFRPFSSDRNDDGPLASLTVSYSNRFTGRFDYAPTDRDSAETNWFEALLSPSKYREETGNLIHYNMGMVHTAGINSKLLPSDYISLNGTLSFNEYWVPFTLQQSYDTENERVVEELNRGFNAARDFSIGLSLNTKLYGIMNRKFGSVTSIRHTFIPTMRFNYRPDFSDERWGFYDSYERPLADGTSQEVSYSKFARSPVGGPGSGRSMSLSLNVTNTFEAKTMQRDTTGQKKEQVIRFIDNFGFGTAYNFAAEQFKLSDLNTTLTSSIFKNLRLSAGANFSFYATDTLGNRIDTYLWSLRRKPVRLTSLNFSTGTSFKGGKSSGFARPNVVRFAQQYDPFDQGYFGAIDPGFFEETLPDFSVPWSVSLNFSYRVTRRQVDDFNYTAILNASRIEFNPTKEWNISTSIGYDFITKQLTPSRFTFTRRLHCWNMTFQWNPFGKAKFFLFRLNVNSEQFQSLFQKLPGLNNLEQNSSSVPNRGFNF